MDSFYIGNLKGVGKVYQLTAVDTYTRWAMVWLVHGVVNKDVSVAFFERIWTTWSKMGFPIEAIVADNGPEYKATAFADALAAKNVTRCSRSRLGHRTTTPSLNASKEPCSKNAGAQRSTGSASTASASCNAKPTPGSPATTTGAATTATTWPADDPSTYSN